MPHTPVRSSERMSSSSTPRKLHFVDEQPSRLAAHYGRRQTFEAPKSFQTPGHHTQKGPMTTPHMQFSLQPNHSTDSECESEVSVSKLKGWLDDFGQQNKNHYDKVNKIGLAPNGVPLQKVTRPKVPVKQQPTSAIRPVKRPTDSRMECRKGPTMTPVRFKIQKNDMVQATDNGYASVKELSAWLAGDPTTAKDTKGCVRRGVNVINASRMFEKDLADVIVEEVGMMRGEVNDKGEWLNNAFEEEGSDFDRRSAVTELVSVKDKKKWLTGAFGGSAVECEREARSCVSVNDKRQWLQSAFKKGSERMLDCTDDADVATPAKEKWKAHARRRSDQFTAKRTPSRPVSSSSTQTSTVLEDTKAHAPQPFQGKPIAPVPVNQKPEEKQRFERKPVTAKPTTHAPQPLQDKHIPAPVPVGQKPTEKKRFDKKPAITKPTAHASQPLQDNLIHAPVSISQKPEEKQRFEQRPMTAKPTHVTPLNPQTNEQNRQFQPTIVTEEPLGFQAARELLVKRSVNNGNPVTVLTKVQMRKNKFERWEKDLVKGTTPTGLLKSTWEPADGRERPSTQYAKTFVPDIAPKKSFDELP